MKVKQDMVVHYRKSFFDEKDEFFLMAMDMSSSGYVAVCPVTVEFEVPDDFNPVAAQVATLEAEKASITKAFTAKVAELNEKISKLQAISYEVVA